MRPGVKVFHTMPAEEAWRAIEQMEDELTPAQKAEQAFRRQFVCPRCKTDSLQERYDSRHAFSGDQLVPRALLRCGQCELLLEPGTGLILEHGKANRQPSPTSLHNIGPSPAEQQLERMVGDVTGQDLEHVRNLIRSSYD